MPAAPTAVPPPAATEKKSFGRAFWCLNTIEMWERLAYYTLRVLAPIYIAQADNPGGLHLSQQDKGTIYAWWAIFQSLLPIVTGGFADRFGYKRTLAFSFTMMTSGYLIIAFMRDIPGIDEPRELFWAFFTGIMVLATGTAFFKPSIQGSLAQSLTKENSSVGWSIFYWVVNIGALIGHYLPYFFMPNDPAQQTAGAWKNVFLAAAGISLLNFVMLLTYKDVPSGSSKEGGVGRVLVNTVVNIFDARLIAWLLIMSGFWMMMYQLWDLQPSFITDWVSTTPLAEQLKSALPAPLAGVFVAATEPPTVPQQVILSLNSILIIAGVIVMGWLTRRMRTLTAMLGGMILCAAGVLIAGLTQSIWMLLAGIVFFSLGEMTTGPKKSEYLALIAPPGKKGLYLGYVNIPVGFGVYVGSQLAGYLYGNFGEKATLALKHLQSIGYTSTSLDVGKLETTLEKAVGVPRTNAFDALTQHLGQPPSEVTRLLWDTYTPQYYVWLPFAATGFVCAIALYIYGQMAKRWNDMNA